MDPPGAGQKGADVQSWQAFVRRRAVHGKAPTVNRILDHPDIRAVAFVGSNGAGKHILQRGTATGKRIQARR